MAVGAEGDGGEVVVEESWAVAHGRKVVRARLCEGTVLVMANAAVLLVLVDVEAERHVCGMDENAVVMVRIPAPVP